MGAQGRDELPKALPRGPHGIESEVVAASQRARMLDAMAATVAGKGYGATTVADVIRAAGVSRKTFYEQFGNKEDCFLAAFDRAAAVVAEAVVGGTLAAPDPDSRLPAGYAALLRALAAAPDYARAFAVVAPEAGPAVQKRRAAWVDLSVERIRNLYAADVKSTPELPPELPDFVARMIVGAGDALIVRHIESVGVDSLEVLTPTLVSMAHAMMHAQIQAPLEAPPEGRA